MGETKKPAVKPVVRTGRTTEIMYVGNGSAYLRLNQYEDQSCTVLHAYSTYELTPKDVDVMKLAASWHLLGDLPNDEPTKSLQIIKRP